MFRLFAHRPSASPNPIRRPLSSFIRRFFSFQIFLIFYFCFLLSTSVVNRFICAASPPPPSPRAASLLPDDVHPVEGEENSHQASGVVLSAVVSPPAPLYRHCGVAAAHCQHTITVTDSLLQWHTHRCCVLWLCAVIPRLQLLYHTHTTTRGPPRPPCASIQLPAKRSLHHSTTPPTTASYLLLACIFHLPTNPSSNFALRPSARNSVCTWTRRLASTASCGSDSCTTSVRAVGRCTASHCSFRY